MADTDAKVGLLGSLPLFAGCSPRQVQRLGALCDWISVPAGTTLTVEGRAGLEFFLITEGAVDVTAGGTVRASLGSGEFFGELALLDYSRLPLRNATVATTADSRLFCFDARGFASMLDEMPEVARRIREQAEKRRAPATA